MRTRFTKTFDAIRNISKKIRMMVGKKKRLTIDEEQDDEYELVKVTNVGITSLGFEGFVILKTIDGKEFPISAFSGEVAHHISNFLNEKQVVSTVYNMIEQLSEEMNVFLVKIKLFDSGGALRANLYYTGKKDIVLRSFRASDAIALATFYHVPILIRKSLLLEKIENK